jgi:hypothetical protein
MGGFVHLSLSQQRQRQQLVLLFKLLIHFLAGGLRSQPATHMTVGSLGGRKSKPVPVRHRWWTRVLEAAN